MFLASRSPKAVVIAAFPKAVCKKSYSGKVVITLGAIGHDRLTHTDRDSFSFSYGTSAECWDHVADALGLYQHS